MAERYQKVRLLGKGSYGDVYEAIDTLTQKSVAIKRIRHQKQRKYSHISVTREINLLKELKHKNIIEFLGEWRSQKNDLYIVFELMDTDLDKVLKDPNIILSPAHVKSYIKMILQGLDYCHKNKVMHRDLKPNNLLIGDDGELKLGDFGFGRKFDTRAAFTEGVCNRWYRAPELLYGETRYGPEIDIWSAGCIFAELMLRRTFLKGSSDIEQLAKIFEVFGTGTGSEWSIENPPKPLASYFPMASEDALDLLSKMFTHEPHERISAEKALEHRYFSSDPPPTDPATLQKSGLQNISRNELHMAIFGTVLSSSPRNVSGEERPTSGVYDQSRAALKNLDRVLDDVYKAFFGTTSPRNIRSEERPKNDRASKVRKATFGSISSSPRNVRSEERPKKEDGTALRNLDKHEVRRAILGTISSSSTEPINEQKGDSDLSGS